MLCLISFMYFSLVVLLQLGSKQKQLPIITITNHVNEPDEFLPQSDYVFRSLLLSIDFVDNFIKV